MSIALEKLRDQIRQKFMGEEIHWTEFEPETILLELGLKATWVNIDRVGLLKVLERHPDYWAEDPVLFLHAVDVINNNKVDFSVFPTPTSLEVAFALVVLHRLYPDHQPFSEGLKEALKWILIEEGYSAPVAPFSAVLGTKAFAENVAPVTSTDLEDKAKAVKLYIEGMLNGNAST